MYFLNTAQHTEFPLASQLPLYFQRSPYPGCRGDGSGQDQPSPWGFNLHMTLGHLFKMMLTIFQKKKILQMKQKRNELAPTRIFNPVLQTQGNLTKKLQ